MMVLYRSDNQLLINA